MKSQKIINVVNGIDMETLQETINSLKRQPELGRCRFRVTNKWTGGNQNCNIIDGFYGAGRQIKHKHPFELRADEPAVLAGKDKAANPVEQLLSALASCVTTSMVAHAAVRGIHIDELESEIEGELDINGYLGLSEDVPKGYTDIHIGFKVKSDTENLKRLKRFAKHSPVYNTIIHGARVNIQVEPK